MPILTRHIDTLEGHAVHLDIYHSRDNGYTLEIRGEMNKRHIEVSVDIHNFHSWLEEPSGLSGMLAAIDRAKLELVNIIKTMRA